MKSLVVERPGSLTIENRPLPKPSAGEVRIRVERAGICGSDVHILHGSNPFARYPRVIGHEFFGRMAGSMPLATASRRASAPAWWSIP